MARKKVPAMAGWYSVVFEFAGNQGWADHVHAAFDRWTLKLAQEGPSESVLVLPAFEVVDETENGPALLKLTFVKVTAESGWDAITAAAENLEIIAPELLEIGTAMRIAVVVEQLIGRDVEIDVPDDLDVSDD